MTVHKSVKVINGQTSAGTTDPLTLDWKFDSMDDRGILGSLTAGDTISLLATASDVSSADEVWVTIAAASTTPFAVNFSGVWPRVKVQKSGTNGAANVWIVG